MVSLQNMSMDEAREAASSGSMTAAELGELARDASQIGSAQMEMRCWTLASDFFALAAVALDRLGSGEPGGRPN